jgi:hypothetical protein
MKIAWRLIGLALFTCMLGCASYQNELSEFRSLLQARDFKKAAETIKSKAEADSKDQIVYLLEYAEALQLAGEYKESNAAFQKADDLTDIKDYHSISKVTASLLGSATMVQYKGEDYEKVMINAMMAINFLMLHDLDNANAMTRRLNDKLYKYKYEAKRNYEQNPFAFYISALVWEANKDWDNAYINFKNTYEREPGFDYLKEDLVRAAYSARRMEDLASYKKKWPSIKPANFKEQGEVVLVFQQGWAPVKKPNPNFPRVPKLYPVYSTTESATLEVENGPKEKSQRLWSLTDVAIHNLDDQYAEMIAGRAAGIATKAVVSDQLRQKNELLGAVAWIGMNIADQADLRQWMSLPSTFQIAKLRLRPGKYKVRAVGLTASGSESGENSEWMDVTVAPGKKAFVNWRSVH